MKLRMKLLIVLLLLITAAAVTVTAVVLLRDPGDSQTSTLAPDYAPIEKEEYAESIPEDTGDKMQSEEGGGSVSLTYAAEVTVTLSEEKASLMFANPGRSNQDMLLQIMVQDTVIATSGLLQPGNRITTLALDEGAAALLEAGGYNGMFVVSYYNPETGEKAVLNTEIPIRITVR